MIRNLFLDQQGNFVVTLLLGRIGLALLYIAIAAISIWIIPPLVQRTVLAWAEIQYGGEMTERRQNTIARLMLTLTRAAIVVIATVAVLSLFVDSAGLFTFLGLFTAAMGFALRQTISDYISGFIFLFEDLFAMGDEVEIGGELGIVEDVTMRTTTLRAPTGETRIVPNGDIRTVHNYARSLFSQVAVRVNVPAADFETAFDALDTLAQQLPAQSLQMDGTPQVLIEDATLGSSVTLTMQANARAGSEVEVQRQMIAAVQQTLTENNIAPDGDTAA